MIKFIYFSHFSFSLVEAANFIHHFEDKYWKKKTTNDDDDTKDNDDKNDMIINNNNNREICDAPTLWLKMLNKHNTTYIMYIEIKNVISNLTKS